MNSVEMKENESEVKIMEIPGWREILKRIPNAKSDWRQKRPLQKFCYLYGIGRMAMDAIAFPTFRDDQRLRWFSYFGYTYGTFGVILAFYTVFWYTYHGEFTKALPSTSMMNAGVGSSFAFLVPIITNQRHLLHSLVDFGGRYIYRDRHDDIEYQHICLKNMNASMKHFLGKMLMITLGFTAAVIGPIHAYVFHGIRTTTVELAVPFTDEKSWGEFTVNIMIMGVTATHAGIFFLGGEVVIEIFSNVITISPRLIQHKLRKIISDYAENRMSSAQLRFAFMDFVHQCNDANDYVRNVSDLLYWRSLITPIVFTYSIGMAIYCQLELDFVAGYGIAFMFWTQFFYYCELGESVTDNGFVDILNESDWYLLPQEFQKSIMYLINRQQNIPGLSVGPFEADLNREVFKVITNKIYSFVMFLMSFKAA